MSKKNQANFWINKNEMTDELALTTAETDAVEGQTAWRVSFKIRSWPHNHSLAAQFQKRCA